MIWGFSVLFLFPSAVKESASTDLQTKREQVPCEPQQKLRIFYQVRHATAEQPFKYPKSKNVWKFCRVRWPSHSRVLTKVTCSCSVLVQQQHSAANGGQRRSSLPLVHSELQQTLQPAQTPQALPFTLHLQLCGQSAGIKWRETRPTVPGSQLVGISLIYSAASP